MRRAIAGCAAVALAAFCVIRCGTPTSTSATTTVTSIAVNGLLTYTAIGIKAQYQAIASLSNSSTQDVTSLAVWASSDASRLSVTSGGLATYLAGNGTVSVSATYKGIVGTAVLNLAISPEDCIAYSPAAMFGASFGDAFIVTDGQSSFFALDTMVDANNTVALMHGYSSVCYVGRNNTRSNRLAYIVEYWKAAGPPPALTPEDCTSFDKTALKVTFSAAGYALVDGSTQVALLDTQSDVDLVLSVAKQYSARCYIGRSNTRSNPLNYMVQYWK